MRPGDSLAETAHLVVGVRLRELAELRARITAEEQSDALHDLRIAAKRLRYSLEMFAICFPAKAAQRAADRVRDLQDVLGRIHDLDVLTALMMERIEALDRLARTETLASVLAAEVGPERDAALRTALRRDTARGARAGLYRVVAAKEDERRACYEAFLGMWNTWESDGVIESLQALVDEEQPEEVF
jgi:hypothetical protein